MKVKSALIPWLALCLCLPLVGADKKPLTMGESAKVTDLGLSFHQLIDVKDLEKLTPLEDLEFSENPDLTKAQIAELPMGFPKCAIHQNT